MIARLACSRLAYTTLRATTLALLLSAHASAALDLDEEEPDPASEEAAPDEDLAPAAEDDGLGEPTNQPAAAASEEGAKGDPAEKPPWLLLGVRYRIAVVPQFLINMFGVQGGRTVVIHGGGPEIGFSQKDFEIIVSPWFAGYSLETTPFKGPSDGANAWELVESHLSVAYLTADFLWKTHISKKVDFQIGAGAGIGIVFGNLYRNDAYWGDGTMPILPVNGDPYNTTPSPTNPALAPCFSAGVPTSLGGQCPPGGQYNSNGPAQPWPVYPWLTFQTGLRYSPARNFVGRLDLGIGATGFWFGLGADYGI